jgi:hypothetical protein
MMQTILRRLRPTASIDTDRNSTEQKKRINPATLEFISNFKSGSFEPQNTRERENLQVINAKQSDIYHVELKSYDTVSLANTDRRRENFLRQRQQAPYR